MKTLRQTCVTLWVVLCTSSIFAQSFSDGLDDLASWNVVLQEGGTAEVINYGLLGIPEAPNRVAGSSEFTGIQLTANVNNGSPAAINLIGAVEGANANITTDVYQLQFDMWLNTSNPLPAVGSTEQGLWGIARTTDTPIGKNNSLTDGDGVFGWLATENGYNTEDTVIFSGMTEHARKDGSTHRSLFNSTFTRTVAQPGPITANAAANQWVEVAITVNQGTVQVFYNKQEFFRLESGNTVGDLMLGYEDLFASIGSAPEQQFGISIMW